MVKLVINRTDEAAFRALTGFQAYQDPRIALANNVARREAPRLDITRLDDRAIGIFNAAEVWVKPWAIANYMFAYDQTAEQKPLVLRTRDGQGTNLQGRGRHRRVSAPLAVHGGRVRLRRVEPHERRGRLLRRRCVHRSGDHRLIHRARRATDSISVARIARTQQRQHSRTPFELLTAFSVIGATASGGSGEKKSGTSKRASKRATKRGGSKTAADAGDGSASRRRRHNSAIRRRRRVQSRHELRVNRPPRKRALRRSRRAGEGGAPKKFDETVPGGRYKGTDGKYRSADGALHEDQSE
jgi:hypothetical protein